MYVLNVMLKNVYVLLKKFVSLKGIPVIRTIDKRGGTPSLQTTTTKVRNIYM